MIKVDVDGVRVKVPASTANLGPAFDTLGMALSLFAWIGLKQAEHTSYQLYGEEMKGLGESECSLIYKVAQMVFEEAGISVPHLQISISSDIPLTRGLGSSASAIVGTLFAANKLIGSPLSISKLFDMAVRIENHPDNVGASLFGGIVSSVRDGSNVSFLRFDPPTSLEVLVAIPEYQLSTTVARQVLPENISRDDAIFNISRASLLTGALIADRLDLIAVAMQDRLHQPYRAPLIPGMERILREAQGHGAVGVALSGAGPTLLALMDSSSERKQELEQFIGEVLTEHGVSSKMLWLSPCVEGVRQLSADEQGPF